MNMGRKVLALHVAVWVAMTASFPARAEGDESVLEIESTPSMSKCATGTTAALAYPEGMAEKGFGATIRVRLSFHAPDKEPDAEVFYDTAAGPFRAAVLRHVSGYRMPCMSTGAPPVVVTREFQFVAGDGRKVHWAPLREDARPSRHGRLACVTGAAAPPPYPASSIDQVTRGTVFVRFAFVSPDEPPDVRILFDGGSKRFAKLIESHVSGYRLPCMQAGEPPIWVEQQFQFRLDGDPGNLLRDAMLVDFLRAIKLPQVAGPRFDFQTMGCPFDVRFVLRRPYMSNAVGEVGKPDPNRREFVEWLRSVDFKLQGKQLDMAIGNQMTVSVPCSVLDLT